MKTITRAVVDLLYSSEALDLYCPIIVEQRNFRELGARDALHIPDAETSSRLLLGMLKGDEHFRCMLGVQPSLSAVEKERLVDSAVSLFLKGHGYEG